MLLGISSFAALPQLELFRELISWRIAYLKSQLFEYELVRGPWCKALLVIFQVVTVLASFVNPSHILVYAPRDFLICRLAITRTI